MQEDKSQKQATFWKSLLNKQEQRRLELEQQRCALKHRLEAMGGSTKPGCMCSTNRQPEQQVISNVGKPTASSNVQPRANGPLNNRAPTGCCSQQPPIVNNNNMHGAPSAENYSCANETASRSVTSAGICSCGTYSQQPTTISERTTPSIPSVGNCSCGSPSQQPTINSTTCPCSPSTSNKPPSIGSGNCCCSPGSNAQRSSPDAASLNSNNCTCSGSAKDPLQQSIDSDVCVCSVCLNQPSGISGGYNPTEIMPHASVSSSHSGSRVCCPCDFWSSSKKKQMPIPCTCDPCPDDDIPSFACSCSSCRGQQQPFTGGDSVSASAACPCNPCTAIEVPSPRGSICPCNPSIGERISAGAPDLSDICECPQCLGMAQNTASNFPSKIPSSIPCNTQSNIPFNIPKSTPNNISSSYPCSTCAQSVKSERPLANSAMHPFGSFSLHSADFEYMDQIFQLGNQQKQMKQQIREMENREKAYVNTLHQADEMWASMEGNYQNRLANVQQGGDNACTKFEKMGEQLMDENSRLVGELKDARLELKHCMEQLTGPITRQMEKERTKNEKLEEELECACKAMAGKQYEYSKEMSNMHNQLQCTCRNLYETNSTNEELKKEMCMLRCKYDRLEQELINQKISEAHTLQRLAECMCQEKSKDRHKKKCCDLSAIAKGLSKTLENIDACCACSKLPSNLKDTVKGIRDIAEMVGKRGSGKPKKKKKPCPCQKEESSSESEDTESESDSETESESDKEPCRDVCTTVTVDASIQGSGGGSISVETEANISIESRGTDQMSCPEVCISEASKPTSQSSGGLSKESSCPASKKSSLSKHASESEHISTGAIIQSGTELSRESKTSSRQSSAPSSRKSSRSERQCSKVSIQEPESQISAPSSDIISRGQSSRSSSAGSSRQCVPCSSHGVGDESSGETPLEIFTEVDVSGDAEVEIDTEVNVYETISDGINITTTITGSGTLEVITEGPAGIIETIMTYTPSGNIEVTTEITDYPSEKESMGSHASSITVKTSTSVSRTDSISESKSCIQDRSNTLLECSGAIEGEVCGGTASTDEGEVAVQETETQACEECTQQETETEPTEFEPGVEFEAGGEADTKASEVESPELEISPTGEAINPEEAPPEGEIPPEEISPEGEISPDDEVVPESLPEGDIIEQIQENADEKQGASDAVPVEEESVDVITPPDDGQVVQESKPSKETEIVGETEAVASDKPSDKQIIPEEIPCTGICVGGDSSSPEAICATQGAAIPKSPTGADSSTFDDGKRKLQDDESVTRSGVDVAEGEAIAAPTAESAISTPEEGGAVEEDAAGIGKGDLAAEEAVPTAEGESQREVDSEAICKGPCSTAMPTESVSRPEMPDVFEEALTGGESATPAEAEPTDGTSAPPETKALPQIEIEVEFTEGNLMPLVIEAEIEMLPTTIRESVYEQPFVFAEHESKANQNLNQGIMDAESTFTTAATESVTLANEQAFADALSTHAPPTEIGGEKEAPDSAANQITDSEVAEVPPEAVVCSEPETCPFAQAQAEVAEPEPEPGGICRNPAACAAFPPEASASVDEALAQPELKESEAFATPEGVVVQESVYGESEAAAVETPESSVPVSPFPADFAPDGASSPAAPSTTGESPPESSIEGTVCGQIEVSPSKAAATCKDVCSPTPATDNAVPCPDVCAKPSKAEKPSENALERKASEKISVAIGEELKTTSHSSQTHLGVAQSMSKTDKLPSREGSRRGSIVMEETIPEVQEDVGEATVELGRTCSTTSSTDLKAKTQTQSSQTRLSKTDGLGSKEGLYKGSKTNVPTIQETIEEEGGTKSDAGAIKTEGGVMPEDNVKTGGDIKVGSIADAQEGVKAQDIAKVQDGANTEDRLGEQRRCSTSKTESKSRIPISKRRSSKLAANIVCDCGDCECKICSPDVMKRRQKSKTDLSLRQECSCTPDCTCKICAQGVGGQKATDMTHSSSVPVISSQKAVVPPEGCDCVECLCDPCGMIEEHRSRTDSEGTRRTSSSPIITSDYDQTASKHPEDCDCVDCLCDPGRVHERMQSEAEELQKSLSRTRSRSRENTCIPCMQRSITDAALKSEKTTKHSAECDCLECLCDPCKEASVEDLTKHPPECDCLACLCDAASSKKTTSDGTHKFPPEKCTCPECLCLQGIPPTISNRSSRLNQTLSSSRHKSGCSCDECLHKQETGRGGKSSKHPIHCACPDCADEGPDLNMSEAAIQSLTHPLSCDCTECTKICGEVCPYTKMSEQLSGKAADNTVHQKDCNCVDCIVVCSYTCPDPKAKQTATTNHIPDCDCVDCSQVCAGTCPDTKVAAKSINHMPGCNCADCSKICGTANPVTPERNKEMEELDNLIKQIQCACNEAELRASASRPASVQESSPPNNNTISSLQVALEALQNKCQQKDRMIAAITQELKIRANSKIFDQMLQNLAKGQPCEPCEPVIDFDRKEICDSLPRPVCDRRFGKPSSQAKEPQICDPCHLPTRDASKNLAKTEKQKPESCKHSNYPKCPCSSGKKGKAKPERASSPKQEEHACKHSKYPNCECNADNKKSKNRSASPKHRDSKKCTCAQTQTRRSSKQQNFNQRENNVCGERREETKRPSSAQETPCHNRRGSSTQERRQTTAPDGTTSFSKINKGGVGDKCGCSEVKSSKQLRESQHSQIRYPSPPPPHVADTQEPSCKIPPLSKQKSSELYCQCNDEPEPIDCSPMEITELRRITADSLLVKWIAPASKLVVGYEILVDGVTKSRVHSSRRTSAMLHSLCLQKCQANVAVYALSEAGRIEPPAKAVFQL